jgi:hypothetical protein
MPVPCVCGPECVGGHRMGEDMPDDDRTPKPAISCPGGAGSGTLQHVVRTGWNSVVTRAAPLTAHTGLPWVAVTTPRPHSSRRKNVR